MSTSDKPPWYASGLRFTCTQCGNCCGGAPGYVWVTQDEVERIARHLGLGVEQFMRRHTRRVGLRLSLLELPGGDCEFLERADNGKTGCRIHRVRPLQCRTWPFWESNVESEAAWRAAARDCPGIDHGPLHPLPVIEDCLRRNEADDLPL